ncbi:MAG: sigma-70 family RNA polymerase sigma factor [Oscillospiraceae bacterium]|nr:sigma-70 family RNA polymerase sigma factor [Oscillospiraceae bacterium]
MAWNYRRAKEEFDMQQETDAEAFRASGASEETIEKWNKTCLHLFNRDRSYIMHTKSMYVDNPNGESGAENYVISEAVSQVADYVDYDEPKRNNWLDELENTELVDVLRLLSDDSKELLTLFFFDELTTDEIAKHFGITKDAVIKRKNRILLSLRNNIHRGGTVDEDQEMPL